MEIFSFVSRKQKKNGQNKRLRRDFLGLNYHPPSTSISLEFQTHSVFHNIGVLKRLEFIFKQFSIFYEKLNLNFGQFVAFHEIKMEFIHKFPLFQN